MIRKVDRGEVVTPRTTDLPARMGIQGAMVSMTTEGTLVRPTVRLDQLAPMPTESTGMDRLEVPAPTLARLEGENNPQEVSPVDDLLNMAHHSEWRPRPVAINPPSSVMGVVKMDIGEQCAQTMQVNKETVRIELTRLTPPEGEETRIYLEKSMSCTERKTAPKKTS